ncbi:hydrogenase formation protein HypD [Limnochorda pilosa]|uniref:Hydrogenase expression/formation protein HypD n=1 Tax=Limnochorda pilosa TaxID=1555112 RepID=A0A0K2SHD1_LIMPI|nr:hydrogenase formation protein HypD [Limnochorda pilosa]BAS26500.1 hydrogenase expression/formation protein HypD [Limnochorda pilosa]
MRFVDEFRQQEAARGLARALAATAARLERPVRIMEVCGGHTHAIFKFGLSELLPAGVEMLHGPGCPVCVTPRGKVEAAIALARRPDTVLVSFGDMLRVPGRRTSLLEERAQGADVRMVYSALDAVEIARSNPDRTVVWLAIGFETTVPGNAVAVLRASALGLENFYLLTSQVLLPPALRAILDAPDVQVDAFIGPGHVSTIIGTEPYRFVAESYRRPVVITGFEPLDLLQGIHMIVQQVAEDRSQVEVQYRRAVPSDGNPIARRIMAQVFEPVDQEWRGLGTIPASGLRLRESYAHMDAERAFAHLMPDALPDSSACRCGEVLRGVVRPPDCPLFGRACTPERPMGACMVSPEGACAAYYRYRPHARGNRRGTDGAAGSGAAVRGGETA